MYDEFFKKYKEIIFEAEDKEEKMMDKDIDPDDPNADEKLEEKENTEKTADKPEDKEETEKSDEKADDKSEDAKAAAEDDEEDNSKKTVINNLKEIGFKKQSKGVYVNKDFSDLYSVGISFNNVASESVFEKLAYSIICEASEETAVNIKIKSKKSGKKIKIKDVKIPANLIGDELKRKLTDIIDANEELKELIKDPNQLEQIITAWDKLSDDEQDAFEFFYGDKIINIIKAGNSEGDK